MKSVDQFIIKLAKRIIEKREQEEEGPILSANQVRSIKLGTAMGINAVEKSYAEGEDRITFELTAAVGGRILNVRRYDTKTDRHNQQTYVIPSGEDVGARVAKILNLELIK